MPIAIDDLIRSIPAGTRHAVEEVKRRLNTTIRRVLREETGLRLAGVGDDPHDRASVPVRVAPGLPRCLRSRALADDAGLALMLAPHRHALRRLRDGMLDLEPVVATLIARPGGEALVGGRHRHLEPVGELAALLLRESEKVDLVRWILEVDEDVLGVYEYGASDFGPEARIGLHWSVIGLCAGQLGTPLADLATVVLAHELAHAYTHLGRDIDGERWEVQGFREAEHALKEGLAQYYTARVGHRLLAQAPGCQAAYEALLPRQPRAYHAHVPWLVDYTPEEVRFAMIAIRREPRPTLADFERRLLGTRREMRSLAAQSSRPSEP